MVEIHLHVRNHLQMEKEGTIELRNKRGGVSQITGDIINIRETGERPEYWDGEEDSIHYTVSPNMMKHQLLLQYIRGCDFVTVHD